MPSPLLSPGHSLRAGQHNTKLRSLRRNDWLHSVLLFSERKRMAGARGCNLEQSCSGSSAHCRQGENKTNAERSRILEVGTCAPGSESAAPSCFFSAARRRLRSKYLQLGKQQKRRLAVLRMHNCSHKATRTPSSRFLKGLLMCMKGEPKANG